MPTAASAVDHCPQPADAMVPVARTGVEPGPRLGQTRAPKVPQAFPAKARAADQPGLLQHAQMFGHRLTRQGTAPGQTGDRAWPAIAQAYCQPQPRLIPQGGKKRDGKNRCGGLR